MMTPRLRLSWAVVAPRRTAAGVRKPGGKAAGRV